MNFLSKFKYTPLASVMKRDLPSDSEPDEEETKGILSGTQTPRVKTGRTALVHLTLLNVCILLLSSTLFATWFYNRHFVLNADYRRVSSYSPVHDRFDLEPEMRKIDGTFYPPAGGGDIARQQPNSNADVIWDEWELTRVYPIVSFHGSKGPMSGGPAPNKIRRLATRSSRWEKIRRRWPSWKTMFGA